MPEIIKTYRQSMEATRFIGKRYTDKDRVDGMFGAKWGEWFEKGWFAQLESHVGEGLKSVSEDGEATIGLVGAPNEEFEYWIGYFTPEGTTVPEGFQHLDFPKRDLGVCWIYGKEDEVYMQEGPSCDRLKAEGFKVLEDWCFERYTCPRYTTPDDKGNIILDICFFVE